MKQLELIIQNPTGLHARPAAVFVNTAKQFQAKVQIQHGPKKANAKNILSVLTLGVKKGGQIHLTLDGPDEDEALLALKTAIESGLGDEIPLETKQSKPQPAQENTPYPKTPPQAEPILTPSQNSDQVMHGLAGASGIAIGPVYQFRPAKFEIPKSASDPDQERKQLQNAIVAAQTELNRLHAEVSKRIGAHEAAIFEAHLAILDDIELQETAHAEINNGSSAGWAWKNTVDAKASQLAELDDDLLAARAADVRDAGNQGLRILVGTDNHKIDLPANPVILVAEDLSPSDTVSLEPDRVLGFCTATGGANSHTAILARALGLPAIVGVGQKALAIPNSSQVILNGDAGTLIIEPDEKTLTNAQSAQYQQKIQRAAALEVAHKPAITQDGHQIEIVANIGNVKDARQSNKFGAEGVGLLRTEFLFLERTTPPTEEEQFGVYRDIATAMDGKPIIVRTLDVGGDKPLPYLPMPTEENPFLGNRGIRLCLSRPELLRTQIRAILRAAEFGAFRIMFPMIAAMEEWRAARQIVEDVRAELNAPPIDLGMMIEVPAAALLASAFAQEVDFFSIGTNDLTQYTLAMDRTNPAVANSADGLHPAVLRLIDQTVKAAHAAGKWTGVCGELGADSQAVPILVGLGVDELSVSVPAIPTVKAQIRSLSLAEAQQLAAQALACDTATDVRKLVISA
jgi:phosphocarrier protein FPr